MARTILSGGGITSNKYRTSKEGQKVEPTARAANVAGVAQQGMATAFKKEPLVQGKGYEPAKMGAVDRPSYKGPTEAAPGSNRTIYPSGLQAKTPPAREMEPGRDVFNERPNKGNRP
jgi:hypothetical protein